MLPSSGNLLQVLPPHRTVTVHDADAREAHAMVTTSTMPSLGILEKAGVLGELDPPILPAQLRQHEHADLVRADYGSEG